MPATYASIPTQGIIKTVSATAAARTAQYSFIMVANSAYVLSASNVSRTSFKILNQDPVNTLWYTFITSFVTADPTITPTAGIPGITLVAFGTAPAWPSTGGNVAFPLYIKTISVGPDTNWALVNVTAVGFPILPLQSIPLDSLQAIAIGTSVGATMPVTIDEGSVV